MRKRVLLFGGAMVLAIIVCLVFLVGGRARTDVYLKDFEVSENGKRMVLKVGVWDSAGYARKMEKTDGSMNGYYTFYSGYGFNSKIGAKDTFEIELDDNMDEIYFYTGDKGYRLVLVKDKAIDEWYDISYADDEMIKIDLPKKDDVIKVGINTYSLDNNYFEYGDNKAIDEIYDIFNGLETLVPSTTYNPDVNDEMYAIFFYTNEDTERFEYYIDVYKKDDKYYVEQRYNGIYEITEDDFNLIKSYIK